MNGTRGLVIATPTAFLLGCSSGLIAGILLVHGFGFARPPWEMRRPPRPGRPGEGPMMGMIARRLDFTPEQRDEVDQILNRTHRQIEAVHDSTRAAIERVLTDRQRREWNRLELRLHRVDRRWPRLPPPEPNSHEQGRTEGDSR